MGHALHARGNAEALQRLFQPGGICRVLGTGIRSGVPLLSVQQVDGRIGIGRMLHGTGLIGRRLRPGLAGRALIGRIAVLCGLCLGRLWHGLGRL